MQLFGIDLTKAFFEKKKKKTAASDDAQKLMSIVAKGEEESGAMVVGAAGGWNGHYVDINGGTATNDRDLIMRYRTAATCAECDSAISDIVDATIVTSDTSAPVSIVLDELNVNDSIKKKITEEFTTIVRLLNFNKVGTDIFRQWYVDGRLYYHLVVNSDKPGEGIQEVRKIDPTKIKKIREVQTTHDPASGAQIVETIAEYFLYSDTVGAGNSTTGIRIDPNSIVYVPSGLLDETQKIVVSHLHKSLKLVANLRMLEDALVIYRIARAPERRIFYLDVGNLPKGKSEEYVQSMMSKYRNKLVYDSQTGEIKDERKTMSMMEDFWLPRREGGKGTEITTLPGGENLGQIEDVKFFQQKLYRSLNVPISRLESESMFTVGRSTEISRDEVKFQKFINKLRKKFSYLMIDMLRVQLVLKGIITDEDWEDFRESISVDYVEDNYFSQLKEFEILRERITMADSMQSYIGLYYSRAWLRQHVLGQSEEDIKRLDAEISKEGPPPNAEVDEDGSPIEGGGAPKGGDDEDEKPEKKPEPKEPKKKKPVDGLGAAEKEAMKSM
jgi:hypothetical protein